MICLGKRKATAVATFFLLCILVFIVNHFLSTTISTKQDHFYLEHQESLAFSNLKETTTTETVQKEVVKLDPEKKINFIKNPTVRTARKDEDAVEHRESNDIFVVNEQKEKTYSTRYIPKHRVVHLDLKGAPPKLSYIKTILPLIREAGATALLIEYEDMFPFWGPLKNISAKNCYTAQEIQKIQVLAAQNNLIVIPLIQTFGHLEFLLKLDEFKHLREVPIYPQSICPSHNETWNIIEQIIDQVFSLHPYSEWIHIGCDEVYQIGQCSKCSERIANANKDPDSVTYHSGKTLFLEHVHRVASYVRNNKKRIPIIWDDMLRSIQSQTIINSGIGSLVEPMVWVYIEDIDRFVDSLTWATYGSVFDHLWAASAFKGAFGERLYSVNIQRHVANHLSWLEVMSRESQSSRHISFRGIALTGWSRYDHFAVLCELLPVALPSLVLNLAILARGGQDFEAIRRAHRILQCGTQKAVMTPEELRRNPIQWDLHRCSYPGSNLISLLSTYNMNRKEVEMAWEKVDVKEGWMTQYNVDHRYSSPYRVHEAMRPIVYLTGSLKSLEGQIEKSLSQYFDTYTVKEWIEQHIIPLQKTVEEINSRATLLTSAISWPQRPLGFIENKESVEKMTKKSSKDE